MYSLTNSKQEFQRLTVNRKVSLKEFDNLIDIMVHAHKKYHGEQRGITPEEEIIITDETGSGLLVQFPTSCEITPWNPNLKGGN